VFNNNQAKAAGNYIIFKGCQGLTGRDRRPKVKITSIMTPFSAKKTGEFKVEMYKSYQETTNTLDNLIIYGTGSIPATMFTSGKITQGSFDGFIKFIQTRASHEITFSLKNSFPAKNTRLVVGMPERMTWDSSFEPSVRNLDGGL
jgi:hypothetical protein